MFIVEIIIAVIAYIVLDRFLKPFFVSTGEKLVDHYWEDLKVVVPDIYNYFDDNLDEILNGDVDMVDEMSTRLVDTITELDRDSAVEISKSLLNGAGKLGYSVLVAVKKITE